MHESGLGTHESGLGMRRLQEEGVDVALDVWVMDRMCVIMHIIAARVHHRYTTGTIF